MNSEVESHLKRLVQWHNDHEKLNRKVGESMAAVFSKIYSVLQQKTVFVGDQAAKVRWIWHDKQLVESFRVFNTHNVASLAPYAYRLKFEWSDFQVFQDIPRSMRPSDWLRCLNEIHLQSIGRPEQNLLEAGKLCCEALYDIFKNIGMDHEAGKESGISLSEI